MSETIVCTHGQLARQCIICQRDSEIAELKSALEKAEKALTTAEEICEAEMGGNSEISETLAEIRTLLSK